MFLQPMGIRSAQQSRETIYRENGTIYKWYDKYSHKSLRVERISRRFDNDARVSGPRLRAENPDRAA